MTTPSGAEALAASAPELLSGGAPWLRARARNALRHPVRIGVVAGAVFLVTLIALIVVPAGQRRAAEQSPVALRRLDTLPILAREHDLDARRQRATRALDSLRHALVAADSADSAAAERPRRATLAATDSTAAQVRELTRLLARADRAPLPATYRELATARALAGDATIAARVDALAAIERLQRAYGTAPAIDSGYLALSERARGIGDELVAIARARRSALRGDAPEDTLRLRARLDTLGREIDATDRQLVLARQVNARAQAAIAAARERANLDAPPIAMLLAALALGLALGGATSLGLELAQPRYGAAVDAWRVTGAGVVATLPSEAGPDLRDATERLAGRVLAPLAPGTRLAVVASDAAHAAHVAVALAGALAAQGRSVLVVDTDTREARSANLLRRPATPGLTDALARGASWESVVQRHIGSHAPPLDVLPPGAPLKFAPGTIAADEGAARLGVLADGYDLTLMTVTPADTPIAEALLAPARVATAIMVVEEGETLLGPLGRARARLAARGVRVAGVVVVASA
ncbi:MAG: hypothetical protein HY275_12445 [Gemmatimonadetes bacterium]|nr:hypothetical protein [Gemmatimonadota bacterium]